MGSHPVTIVVKVRALVGKDKIVLQGRRYPPGWAGTEATTEIQIVPRPIGVEELGSTLLAFCNRVTSAESQTDEDHRLAVLDAVQMKSDRAVARSMASVSLRFDESSVRLTPTKADGPGWQYLDEHATTAMGPTARDLGAGFLDCLKLCQPAIEW